jgi:hypothetical protein
MPHALSLLLGVGVGDDDQKSANKIQLCVPVGEVACEAMLYVHLV